MRGRFDKERGLSKQWYFRQEFLKFLSFLEVFSFKFVTSIVKGEIFLLLKTVPVCSGEIYCCCGSFRHLLTKVRDFSTVCTHVNIH